MSREGTWIGECESAVRTLISWPPKLSAAGVTYGEGGSGAHLSKKWNGRLCIQETGFYTWHCMVPQTPATTGNYPGTWSLERLLSCVCLPHKPKSRLAYHSVFSGCHRLFFFFFSLTNNFIFKPHHRARLVLVLHLSFEDSKALRP